MPFSPEAKDIKITEMSLFKLENDSYSGNLQQSHRNYEGVGNVTVLNFAFK